jgi:hypothetical protein
MYYYDSLDNDKTSFSNKVTDGYAMNGKMQKYYTHGVPEAYEMSKACDGTATASKKLEQRCISIQKTENVHEGLGEALS